MPDRSHKWKIIRDSIIPEVGGPHIPSVLVNYFYEWECEYCWMRKDTLKDIPPKDILDPQGRTCEEREKDLMIPQIMHE